MTLTDADEGMEYVIQGIVTEDDEMDAFLRSLGCYAGEHVTVISQLRGGCVIAVKDGRYSIDNELASAIAI